MGLKFSSDEIASYEAVLTKTMMDIGTTVAERGVSVEIGTVGVEFGARIFIVFLLNYLEQNQLTIEDESGCLALLMRRNTMKELKFISTLALISLPELISIFITSFPHTVNAPMDASSMSFIAVSVGIGFALFDPIRDAFILFYKEWEKKKKIEEAMEERAKQDQIEVDYYTSRAERLIQGFISYLVERQRLDTEEGKKRREREEKLQKNRALYEQSEDINDLITLGRTLNYSDQKIYRDCAKKFHSDRGGNDEKMKTLNARYNKIIARFK